MLLSALAENVLVILAYDNERASTIRGLIDPSLFGGLHRQIAVRIYDYIDRYKKPPGDHLPDLFPDKLESQNQREVELFVELFDAIKEAKEHVNPEYVMATLGVYIKRQSLRSISADLVKHLQRDTEADIEKAELLLAGANRQALTVFDAGTRLSDPKRALKFLDESVKAFPTGIKELDVRGFGPTRKELWMAIAEAKAGKCIVGGEPIFLSNGRCIPIEQFDGSETVVAVDPATGCFTHEKATLSYNGLKTAFRVVTRTGRYVSLTGNHPLLTKAGWVTVDKLKIGDKIAAPAVLPFFGTEKCSTATATILGYLIADGGLTKPSTPTFSKHDEEMVADFISHAKEFSCTLTPNKTVKGEYWVTGEGKGIENKICTLLRSCNLLEHKSNTKEVPNLIFESNKASVVAFLRALFTCDGSVYAGISSARFEYSTTSPKLARQVDGLLTKFGLVCRTRERWQKVNGEPYVSWSLCLAGRRTMEKFKNEIGLSFSKGRKLNRIVKNTNRNADRTARVSYLCNDTRGDLFFDSIIKIEPLGAKHTYDLSVSNKHNFVCGNLIVHNTWLLTHLAKMAVLNRMRVVHVSLEMSEERCTQRYFQALFSIAKRDDLLNTTRITLDDLGRISGFDVQQRKPKLTLSDPNIRVKLQRKIEKFGTRFLDNIFIKEFPTGSLTMGQLTAYLDHLETSERFTPDLLIVDYPDLMKLDVENFRHSISQLVKELRGLGVSRNMAVAAVSQANREGAKAKQLDATHVAEDWSKVANADTIITYKQTEAERRLGLARLFVAGGRNDQDRITIVISQQYATGGFVIDSALMRGTYWESIGQTPDEPIP